MTNFIAVMFRRADTGTYVSLRSFFEDRGGVFEITAHRFTDTEALVRAALSLAAKCANAMGAVVFCPPIAVFNNPRTATERDLVNGLALSVECDNHPAEARMRLEALLGPATAVVASGGEWIDPETDEIEDKLHLHWRLGVPTRTPEEHALLKRARALATDLAGGDATNKPVVHPIRWPGSWHRKATARLTTCVAMNAEREIDLNAAAERLMEAAERKPATIARDQKAPSARAGTTGVATGEERQTAELVREVLNASDYHAPLAALAMRLLKGGMADPQVVVTLRGIMLAVPDDRRDTKNGIVQPGRWQARYDDIPRAVSTARAKLAASSLKDVKPDDLADLINPATLQGIDPPAREWIVEGWLPVGTVTSLYGGAGFGKTLLAQQLQTATALGAPFLGLPTRQCRSVAFYCEDDEDELHRRQRVICGHYVEEMSALGAMRWQARAGKQNIMAGIENGLLALSEFHDFVCRAVAETGAKLVILDNVAQLFGGNENVRPEVTQFVNALGAIALENVAAVLLLGHPAKATDSEFSGSTAWDAAVRSRWFLSRPVTRQGDDEEPPGELADVRILRKAKANYSGTGDEIALRWDRGAFRVEGAATVRQAVNNADVVAAMNAADSAFLACLDKLTEQGRNVSASKSAQNFAPKVMFGKPGAAGQSRRKLASAMERLFDAGEIEVSTFGRRKNRHPLTGIMRTSRVSERPADSPAPNVEAQSKGAPSCAEPPPDGA